MNVLFIDFDGALSSLHCHSEEDIEKRVKILSDICKEYNCKVVIESAYKRLINEETMTSESNFTNSILKLLNKYGIECIGITPSVERNYYKFAEPIMWKEDEIRLYLFRHPEIEHYCIIDDNDFCDLEKVKDHLVQTKDYSKNYEEEGLLEAHKEKVGKILEKDNNIRKLVLKRKK